MEEQVEAAIGEPDDARDSGLREVELAVEHRRLAGGEARGGAEVDRLDPDLRVLPRAERAVCVAVDRRVEDEPALALGERRDVGAATRE